MFLCVYSMLEKSMKKNIFNNFLEIVVKSELSTKFILGGKKQHV